MPHNEDAIKASQEVTLTQVRALLKIYGYGPCYLGPIEDVVVDIRIEERLKQGKKVDEIVKESGRSRSTVKRRKEERLGIKKKNPDK